MHAKNDEKGRPSSVQYSIPTGAQLILGAIREGGRIGIALSGGCDSMALLALARKLYPREQLMAFSVRHNIPGVTEDEAQIRSVLQDLNVDGEITLLKWEASELLNLSKGQLQEKLREKRQRALLSACRKNGIKLLLTGHNLEDDIVTMWYRMSHGSGIDGLAGMKFLSTFPLTDKFAGGHFLGHPLLDIPKERLFKTCEEMGLKINHDKSNEDLDFNRNSLQSTLVELQARGHADLESLQEMIQFFKQVRSDMHEEIVPIFDRSIAINKRHGDVTLVLDNGKWLANRPIATRIISILTSYAGCKATGLKTARLITVGNHLQKAFFDYQNDQRRLVTAVEKRTGVAELQPMDLTRRANSRQAVVGGAVFYPMSRDDGLRRVENIKRNTRRPVPYGTVFLVQREPPSKLNHQAVAFRAVTITLAPGETFLWDDRFYLSYTTADPRDTTLRTFQISHLTVADVREYEKLTQGATVYRRQVYSYMGSTPGTHLYQLPVIREVGQAYMAFPTLKAQFPTKYEWVAKFAGDSILLSRLQCLP
jgi:tRNA(Ile)-lysidine synthetase-like protein